MDVRRILEIDRHFFERYQRQLLWLMNTRIGRWYFRIHKDHPSGRKFIRVLPHALEWVQKDGEHVIAFKTADRYANRLKYSLRHLKALLLAIGASSLLSSEKYVATQFLFAGITTSFYPDANVETTTVDGYAAHTGASSSWATLRSAAGNFSEDDSTDYLFAYWIATTTLNQWSSIARGIFLFDTSIIDSASTISSASFKFYCAGKTAPSDADTTKRQLRLASSNPASNTAITGTDYATVGNTSFGSIAYASITSGAVNTVTLNASGIAAITKGGITKLGTRSGADQDNSAPTWASSDQYIIYGRFADYSGTSSDPTLEVTYSAVLTVSETVSMADTQAKSTARAVSDVVASTDSQSNLLVKVKTVSETQSTSDSLGSKSITRSVSDTISATESTQKSVIRSIIDIFSTSDSISKQLIVARAFLETVTLLDVILFWRPRSPVSTAWTNRTEPGDSWSDRTPPGGSWTNRTPPGDSWTDRTPPGTSWH